MSRGAGLDHLVELHAGGDAGEVAALVDGSEGVVVVVKTLGVSLGAGGVAELDLGELAGGLDHEVFVACHNPSYVTKYDMVSKVKDGGVFLLNSPWSAEEMDKQLPAKMKQQLAKKHVRFYNIDAIDLALKVGMGNRINTIMQAAFFKLAEVIPYEQADEYMKA